jgi:hypothetical protein
MYLALRVPDHAWCNQKPRHCVPFRVASDSLLLVASLYVPRHVKQGLRNTRPAVQWSNRVLFRCMVHRKGDKQRVRAPRVQDSALLRRVSGRQ